MTKTFLIKRKKELELWTNDYAHKKKERQSRRFFVQDENKILKKKLFSSAKFFRALYLFFWAPLSISNCLSLQEHATLKLASFFLLSNERTMHLLLLLSFFSCYSLVRKSRKRTRLSSRCARRARKFSNLFIFCKLTRIHSRMSCSTRYHFHYRDIIAKNRATQFFFVKMYDFFSNLSARFVLLVE